jgi:hypothetical protein
VKHIVNWVSINCKIVSVIFFFFLKKKKNRKTEKEKLVSFEMLLPYWPSNLFVNLSWLHHYNKSITTTN